MYLSVLLLIDFDNMENYYKLYKKCLGWIENDCARLHKG